MRPAASRRWRARAREHLIPGADDSGIGVMQPLPPTPACIRRRHRGRAGHAPRTGCLFGGLGDPAASPSRRPAARPPGRTRLVVRRDIGEDEERLENADPIAVALGEFERLRVAARPRLRHRRRARRRRCAGGRCVRLRRLRGGMPRPPGPTNPLRVVDPAEPPEDVAEQVHRPRDPHECPSPSNSSSASSASVIARVGRRRQRAEARQRRDHATAHGSPACANA